MTYIKVDIKPLSIIQLKKKYPKFFYNQSWYNDYDWAKTKSEAETLWIDPQLADSTNKTWDEQHELLRNNAITPTANQLIQCLIQHYESTGERLLEDSFSRVSDVDSDGSRVYLGLFDADGLRVDYSWGGFRLSVLGLASSRKSAGESSLEALDPVDSSDLELRVKKLEFFVDNLVASDGDVLKKLGDE